MGLLDTPAEERFDRITRIARRAFGTKIAVVSLVDADRQWFKSSQGLEISETPRAIAFCSHAIRTDDTFIVADAQKDERFRDNPLVTGSPDVRLYAGQPIHGPTGQRVGTLCVMDPKPRKMLQDEVAMLKDLAVLVENELRLDVLTLSEKQLRQTLSAAERKASIDSLTRMWTRDAIFRLLDLEIERRAVRDEAISGVAMIDIDHFKNINDTHGHPVGDEVLAAVAARIRAALPDRDLVGRYGGEEFLVVFGASEPGALSSVVERIRGSVAQTPVSCAAGLLAATVSIGLCSPKAKPAAGRDALVAAADRALYVAKRNGRNRVVVCSE